MSRERSGCLDTMFPLLQLCVFQKKEKGKFGLILTCSLHCRVQLKGLKRKSLLENLGDGFSKVGMHDLWHEFAVMETTRGEYEHRRWLYDIAGRPLELQPGHLSAYKNLHRIMCCGTSLFDNFQGENFLFHFGKVTVLHLDADQNRTLDVTSLMHLRSLALNVIDNGQVDVPGLARLHNLGFLKVLCKQISAASVEAIGRLTALGVLELKVAQCDKLPDLRNLTSLRVVSCNGFRGAETITGLSSALINLQYLVIRSQSMRSVPGVDTITTLQELDISECRSLVELPNLENLTNLRKLSMTRCKSITELSGFGSLVALQEFLAYDCSQIKALPDVGHLTHLHTLWCNSLKAVPGLGELVALRKLGVEFLGVEDLCQLENLHTLRIDGWSSSGILDTLAALHRLEIRRCLGVHTLTGVENLTMKSFYVDQCEFEDVSVLSNLTSLQELLLEECYMLERLPDLSALTQLESITIECCYSLESLVGIGPLPHLETLHCSASSVTELPDLSDFPRLRSLYLRKCRSLLTLFSIGPLNALVYFNVYKCRSLKSLPDLRGSLQLQTLELRCSGVRLSSGHVKMLKASCRRIQIKMDR
jgi:Leucine-rich repeat (LRR) protein